MKKQLLRAKLMAGGALALSLTITLAGCFGKQPEAQNPAPPADSSAAGAIPTDKPFTIKLMDWQGQNPPYDAAYNNAIQEYMKLHPNVKIERIYQPLANNGYDKLLDTQFVSHNAPDAMQLNGASMINKYTNQEYIMNLEGYFNQPTPYSGGKRWIDTFIGGEAAFLPSKIANRFGALSFIPVDGGPGISENRPFYYNKDLLKKVGVTEPPKTWKEFIEVCRKLKDAGITPVAADNNRWLMWIHNWTGNQFGENYTDRFFDAKYAAPELLATKRTLALLTGKIGKNDPIVNANFDLLKQFSQYWQDGWAGANEQAAQQLFLFQKAAFLLDGNWNYGFYKDNVKGFEWGVMPFPLITKETSPYAEEAMPKGAGTLATYGWGLNKDLEKNPEKLKVVLDLFQYMTSKEAQDRFVDIAVSNSPIEGVHVPEVMKPFMESERNKLKAPVGNAFFLEADVAARTAAAQQFYTGKMTKEQLLATLEESVRKTVTKRSADQLDEKIGLPNTIAEVENQIAELQSSGAPQVLIDTKKKSLDTLNDQLRLYREIAAPVLR